MCCQYSYCLVIQIRMVCTSNNRGPKERQSTRRETATRDDDTARIIARARKAHESLTRGRYRRVDADDEDARDVVKTR